MGTKHYSVINGKYREGEIISTDRKRIGRPIARIVESDVSSPENIYRQKRI